MEMRDKFTEVREMDLQVASKLYLQKLSESDIYYRWTIFSYYVYPGFMLWNYIILFA